MTVTTNIKQMKLNVVTQQQYDSMTKNANELYAVTDASISYKELSDKPAVTSLPTASISNEGDIYQYIGVTDQYYTHGYFYECVSDGAVTPTYSWEQLDIQPAGSSLPSQTGNAGKFLTTDGTDASWSNTVWYDSGLNVGSKTGAHTNIIPNDSNYQICIRALNGTNNGCRLGIRSDGGFDVSNSITNKFRYSAGTSAALISYEDANLGVSARKWKNLYLSGKAYIETVNNGSDITIPTTGGTLALQTLVMPIADSIHEGKIYQFIGTTDAYNTYGYFYKCTNDVQASVTLVQTTGSSLSNIALTVTVEQFAVENGFTQDTVLVARYSNGSWNYNPTANGITFEGTPVEGDEITITYTAPVYSWTQVNVQPGSSGSVPTLTWYNVSTAGTTLTIADTSSAQLVKIYKNGLLLEPTADYSISGTTLTMVTALVVGDKITTEVF